jgi:enoyl-CoA hydratase
MGDNFLKYSESNGIISITFNRPNALNALGHQLLDELEAIMRQIEDNERIRVGIITGNDKVFCVGADIKEMNQFRNALEAEAYSLKTQKVINLFETIPKPFIAAISGAAIGGGCELALACDLRIASENAFFGQPEINLGILPGAGGTQRLPRTVGLTKANEMLFTGRNINANEAFRIGLVNEVVPNGRVLEAAKKMAQEISEKPAMAVSTTKICIKEGLQMNLYQALAYELRCVQFLFDTEDRREGMRAFIEKRKPVFYGR